MCKVLKNVKFKMRNESHEMTNPKYEIINSKQYLNNNVLNSKRIYPWGRIQLLIWNIRIEVFIVLFGALEFFSLGFV